MRRLTAADLRSKVVTYPAVIARIEEVRAHERRLGLPTLPISAESLIDDRKSQLIAKLVKGTITDSERREFVELQVIRTELMLPESMRRLQRRH